MQIGMTVGKDVVDDSRDKLAVLFACRFLATSHSIFLHRPQRPEGYVGGIKILYNRIRPPIVEEPKQRIRSSGEYLLEILRMVYA